MKTEKIKFYETTRAAKIAATHLKKQLKNKDVQVFSTPIRLKSGAFKRDKKTGVIVCKPAVYIMSI